MVVEPDCSIAYDRNSWRIGDCQLCTRLNAERSQLINDFRLNLGQAISGWVMWADSLWYCMIFIIFTILIDLCCTYQDVIVSIVHMCRYEWNRTFNRSFLIWNVELSIEREENVSDCSEIALNQCILHAFCATNRTCKCARVFFLRPISNWMDAILYLIINQSVNYVYTFFWLDSFCDWKCQRSSWVFLMFKTHCGAFFVGIKYICIAMDVTNIFQQVCMEIYLTIHRLPTRPFPLPCPKYQHWKRP